jgi:hypothetical protein
VTPDAASALAEVRSHIKQLEAICVRLTSLVGELVELRDDPEALHLHALIEMERLKARCEELCP